LLAVSILILELPVTEASHHYRILPPAAHGGPFLLALAALSVAWKCFQAPRATRFLLLALLVAGGVMSDLLFVVAYHGPIAAALAYALYRQPIKKKEAGLVLAASAIGLVLGLLVDSMLVIEGSDSPPWPTAEAAVAVVASKVPHHISTLLETPREIFTAAPLIVVLVYVIPLACLVCPGLFGLSRVRDPSGHLDAYRFWWIAAVVGILGTLVFAALAYDGLGSLRYAMPLLWWPIIWSAAALARALRRTNGLLASAGLAGITVALTTGYLLQGPHWPAIVTWHDPLAACLRDAQKTAGVRAILADYWHARRVAASSDWQLQVDQLTEEGAAYYWGNDRFWFTHDISESSRPPDYNAIVLDGLDAQQVQRSYGSPSRILNCPGSEVWLYDDPAVVRRTLANISPKLSETFLEAGQSICMTRERLYLTDRARTGDALASDSGASATPSASSPYFGVPTGRWAISLSYRRTSSVSGAEHWIVTTGGGTRKIFQSELQIAGDGAQAVSMELDGPVRWVEVQVFGGGRPGFEIEGIGITRAGADLPCKS